MNVEEKAKILVKALVKLGVFKKALYHPPDGSKPFRVSGFLEMERITEFDLETKLALALRVKE